MTPSASPTRSRPQRRWLTAVVAAAVGFVTAAAGCTTDEAIGPSAGSGVTAVEVIDGDTLVVDGGERVRIVGINTPEAGECLADTAADRLADLVDDRPLVLVRDVSDTDSFGRLLRYVETSEGIDVGAVLVSEGLALARRYEPDVARAGEYDRLEASARAGALGLWAPDACGSPTVAEGTIQITVNADPPGDDTDDLTGEWVEFSNVGSEPVDLDGFTVADESASNRYVFGDVPLAPGATVRLVTGCGDDTSRTLHWCADGSAVWNNDGDTVFLRDDAGNLVASLTYL